MEDLLNVSGLRWLGRFAHDQRVVSLLYVVLLFKQSVTSQRDTKTFVGELVRVGPIRLSDWSPRGPTRLLEAIGDTAQRRSRCRSCIRYLSSRI